MINGYDLAAEPFTSSCLYALNQYCQITIGDPSNITTAEYWQCHRSSFDDFAKENNETKYLQALRSRQYLYLQPQVAEIILPALEET